MPATKEMTRRGRAYHQYRYRRFQALGDSLEIYFYVLGEKNWVTVKDILDGIEWEITNASMKRVRRICEALERVGRVTRIGRQDHCNQYKPCYYKAIPIPQSLRRNDG
jgi:hypothetical protein